MVMPPYWDNKALPKPTQNFIFNFSFIFIENKCLSDAIMRFEKEKKFGKRRVRTRVDRVKKHVPYHQRPWNWCLISVFFHVDYPNQTLVGRVSVNSVCQQGGLFVLSINFGLRVQRPLV